MDMNAMNRYSGSYARSIVAATPEDMLAEPRRKPARGLSDEQMALMEREAATLDREFRVIQKGYGRDHLALTLAVGYVRNLLANARVVRYLAQRHAVILAELQKIAEFQATA